MPSSARAIPARVRRLGRAATALAVIATFACSGAPSEDQGALTEAGSTETGPAVSQEAVRVGLFNIRELSSEKLEQIDAEGRGTHPDLLAAAAIIQRFRPELLVINEIDAPPGSPEQLRSPALRFVRAYLDQGPDAIDYPHVFVAPSNTGRLSGLDLDGDGTAATEADRSTERYGNDCWGFGTYPGQYGMAVLSQHPLDDVQARTFQTFGWRDLEGHHLPDGFYSAEAAAALRLSSKSHWDLPVIVGDATLHLLVSHPTPPAFDGAEDRNGRRNFDEIALWAAYLDGASWLYDDSGGRGGLATGERFVIAGDLNAAPDDPASYEGRTAISQLLSHPRVQDSGPLLTSRGALAGRAAGPPHHWERSTSGFRDGIRIDYLLPSAGLEMVAGGVFWPDRASDPEGARLAEQASDHHFVWLDLAGISP